jgi:hypothetical protein
MAYVAHVHHDGTIRIYRDNQDRPVAVVTMPPGGSASAPCLPRPGGGRPDDGHHLAVGAPSTSSRSHISKRPGLSQEAYERGVTAAAVLPTACEVHESPEEF